MDTSSGAVSHEYFTTANAFDLIEKLLYQDQASRHYQGRLESRIDRDAAAYQNLSTHCTQVERKVSGLEYEKSQYESSLRVAAETCQAISRDLSLERSKLLQLESRVANLHPSIDAMLHSLSTKNDPLSTGRYIQRFQQLQHDNECQRELITCLQTTIRDREKAIENLKAAIPEAPDFPVNKDALVDGEEKLSDPTDLTDDESSIDIITKRRNSDSST
ncbi:unnamed protein product [Penicillium egyptiacum]|uniref:Uncharacterized protein n=1 Tax=Penicillium egyptiacum TaxID=1303716 RepID=A0A9W4P6D5_9EURO|nr:unnamed protein product [Penicillium egyptiacum]